MSPSDGQDHSHHISSHSNADLPVDPSLAQSSPTYPGPYSPYGPPGGHADMSQYPGHPPGPYGHWPGYGHPHSMAYSSPGAPGSAGGSPATAGPRTGGQVPRLGPINSMQDD